MSLSERERREARAEYGWGSVVKDIALTTPLTVLNAARFGNHFGDMHDIDPFDLVEWVCDFYRLRGVSEADALAHLIGRAFAAGRTYESPNADEAGKE